MAVRNLQAVFTAQFDSMTRALRAIRDQASDTSRITGDAMVNMGRRFDATAGVLQTIGGNMSKYISVPLAGIAGVSVKTAAEFEAQMSRVGAIAGASSSELDMLRDSALELGAATSKSAGEVAIAQEGLAAMGFTTVEIIGAMPGVISAAEASGADMAQTADTMAAALNIFGLEAEEATRVADIFAQTANVSAADMTDLQYALKYAGPPAAALGISIEELSASIGIMADAGISGESAGTSMRAALLALVKPTEKNAELMDDMGLKLTDAEGNFLGVSNMVAELDKSMQGQTDTQKTATLAQLVGTEAVSGFLALMNAGPEKIDNLTTSLENSGGVSAETAKLMKDNLKGALDELGGAVETAAITVGTILIPYVQKAAEFLQGMIQKFQDLEPRAQKAAIVIGAIVTAIGPMILGIGTAVGFIGSLMGVIGPLSGMIVAAGGLVPALGALGTTLLGVATGPIGIAIAAIGGAIVVSGALVKYLLTDSIPAVDRFGDKVSEKTKEALTAFFELSDGASEKLMDLRLNGTEITEETAADMVKTYEAMNKQILDKMKARHDEELADMESFFLNSSALSSEKEAEILRQTEVRLDAREVAQQHFEDRIQQIIETAAEEKRKLTEGELMQIDELHKQMNEAAVEYLSENEMEQKIIMERMAVNTEALSARQAAAVVEKSAEARDKVIADADTKYNDVVAFAIRERDETGSITAEQAEDIIAEAQKTRDTTVGLAEDQHEKIVTEAKEQAGEHVDQVDWETGEILNRWDVYKNGVIERFQTTNKESLEDFKRWGIDFNTAWVSFDGTAKKTVDGYYTNVKKRFTDFNNETLADFKKWGTDFQEGWTNFDTKAKGTVQGYYSGVKKRFTDLNTESLGDFSRWASNFQTAWTNFDTKAKGTVQGYYSGVKKRFTDFNTETAADFGRWGTNMQTGWSNFNTNAQNTVNNWKSNVAQRFRDFFSETRTTFSTWGSNIRTYTSTTFDNIRTTISGAWSNIYSNVRTSTSNILSNMSTAWNNGLSTARTGFKNIYEAARTQFNNIVDGAKALPGRISDGLRSMASKVGSGVNAVANKMSNTLETSINGVIGGINKVLSALGASTKIGTVNLPTYAFGTDHKPGAHPGGLAVVGDGKGSNSGPELVETPNGQSFLSPAEPTLVNLPRGTKVYSATVTKQLADYGHIDIPHYAFGDVLRSVGDWVKSKVSSGTSALLGMLSDPAKMLESALGVSTPSGTGFIGGMAQGGFKKAKAAALEYVKDKIKDYLASLASAGGGTNITTGGGGIFPGMRLTSAPGMRLNPVTKLWAMHNGWDYGAPTGTRIPNQVAGTATQSGYHSIRGNYVRIRSADGYDRIYQHNSRNAVGVGAQVGRGETVGYVGATGRSQGSHLHYEILKYADGGVATKKQLAWLADGGWAESIISHDPAKRSTQSKLWQRTGEELGFTGDASLGGAATELLRRIAEAVEAGQQIVMNEQTVAEILKDPITRLQQLDAEVRGAFG